jgi:hypothetical protein
MRTLPSVVVVLIGQSTPSIALSRSVTTVASEDLRCTTIENLNISIATKAWLNRPLGESGQHV